MAKELSQKLTVDLSSVVANSITAVKNVRKSEQTRKEAEFQRAIANGLSYEEQLRMREKQLETEKGSEISDGDYIASLEKSISDTKKLNRFNKYRTKYAESLGNLSSGKINEEDYLTTLKRQLDGIDDPELRLEIQGDISAAEKSVKTYKDTILSNQVKKAKYDGTTTALSDIISRVNTARAEALIGNNEDDVTAYDETLSALQSQLSSARIQDSITDFQVKSSTRGVNPVEKLNFINTEIQKAEPNTAIKIGDRTFTSAQQFWSLERDNFLAGNSQIFGNFFDELNTNTKNAINVNASRFGYPTQTILDEAFNTFKDLRSKPEIAPFINRLDVTQASVMSDAVDKLAKTINSVGTNNLTFQEADIQLQNIATKYGIDVSGYRLQLDEQLRNLARGGVIGQDEATKLAPDVNVALPKVDGAAIPPVTPVVPGATPPVTPTTPTVGAPRIVKAGDTLSSIAREAGVELSKLLEVNPQLKQNPNIIRPGLSVNIPGQTPATPTPPVVVTPPAAPVVSPATPPVTPPTPTNPTPTSVVVPPVETPKPNQPTYREVIVKTGESISGILNREKGVALSPENQSQYDEVAKLSGITDANKIKPGQKLLIPM